MPWSALAQAPAPPPPAERADRTPSRWSPTEPVMAGLWTRAVLNRRRYTCPCPMPPPRARACPSTARAEQVARRPCTRGGGGPNTPPRANTQ